MSLIESQLDLYMFVFYYVDGDSVADSSSISLLESPPSVTKLSHETLTREGWEVSKFEVVGAAAVDHVSKCWHDMVPAVGGWLLG